MSIFATNWSAANAQYAKVATSQTTASGSYTDLATAGPSVTVNIGPSGLALISFNVEMTNNTGGDYVETTFVASGANTISAGTEPYRLFGQATSASSPDNKYNYTTLLTGLTPGSTTFKLQYRIIIGGTGTFINREISVIPL